MSNKFDEQEKRAKSAEMDGLVKMGAQNRALEAGVEEMVKEYMPKADILDKEKNVRPGEDVIKLVLSGIIIGDVAGMPYEFTSWLLPESADSAPVFQPSARPTDDSVMATAIMHAAMRNREIGGTFFEQKSRYDAAMKYYAKMYPDAGYGGMFHRWAVLDAVEGPIDSFGDGAAMRSGIIGAIFNDPDEVIKQAYLASYTTHAHEEGLKGGIVAAMAVWLALRGIPKEDLLQYMSGFYEGGVRDADAANRKPDGEKTCLDPRLSVNALASMGRATNSVWTQFAVPEAIINFRESDDVESCIRNAFRYKCDADTVGAISGGIAAAHYGTVGNLLEELRKLAEEKNALPYRDILDEVLIGTVQK